MRYTIEELIDYDEVIKDREFIDFMYATGCDLSNRYEWKLDWTQFNMRAYIDNLYHRFMLCRRDGKPVGIHLSRLTRAALDPSKIILYQDLLYTLPNTRAAKLLMDDFIDFGKLRADHIITTISSNTNIKADSLENLGFSKLETLYRLES